MTESPRTYRIALVEDNPGDIYLIQEALREKKIPYTLDIFEDAEKIVERLAERHTESPDSLPDLILLDLNLPRIEGIDLLRSLRGLDGLADIPIGILTSSQSPQDRQQAEAAGASRFIRKPTSLDEFLAVVGGSISEMLQVDRTAS